MQITRQSARAPWPCPNCGTGAGQPCLTNTFNCTPKAKYLPQMHIARWRARPVKGQNMMFIAVKMDCTHPSHTEVRLLSHPSKLAKLNLGSDWLVYQARWSKNGVLLPYNEDTGQHEAVPPQSA